MEEYIQLLKVLQQNSQIMIDLLEKQDFLMQQIKANRLVYTAELREVSLVEEKLKEAQKSLKTFQQNAEYYARHNSQNDILSNVEILKSEVSKLNLSRDSILTFLANLEQEYEEQTAELYKIKSSLDPNAAELKQALEVYLNYGKLQEDSGEIQNLQERYILDENQQIVVNQPSQPE